MPKFRIDYYKSKSLISYKIIEAQDAQKAIKKARVKDIVEVREVK